MGLEWATAAPPLHEASFTTPLNREGETIAFRLASSFRHEHQVSVVRIRESTLAAGSLSSIVESLPEVSHYFGLLSVHQTKTAVLVDTGIPYNTPYRDGRYYVKRAGLRARSPHPHIVYMDAYEESKFLQFGSATLAIVVQRGGLFGQNPARMAALGRALSSQRVESVLVITTDATPPDHVVYAYDYFRRYKVTIGYSEI